MFSPKPSGRPHEEAEREPSRRPFTAERCGFWLFGGLTRHEPVVAAPLIMRAMQPSGHAGRACCLHRALAGAIHADALTTTVLMQIHTLYGVERLANLININFTQRDELSEQKHVFCS
jgi:hypothetical protein